MAKLILTHGVGATREVPLTQRCTTLGRRTGKGRELDPLRRSVVHTGWGLWQAEVVQAGFSSTHDSQGPCIRGLRQALQRLAMGLTGGCYRAVADPSGQRGIPRTGLVKWISGVVRAHELPLTQALSTDGPRGVAGASSSPRPPVFAVTWVENQELSLLNRCPVGMALQVLMPGGLVDPGGTQLPFSCSEPSPPMLHSGLAG